MCVHLKSEKLFFFDAASSPQSVTKDLAKTLHLDAFLTYFQIDKELTPQEIETRLKKLEDLSHFENHTIAFGFDNSLTLQALDAWVKTLAEKDIQLVPLSDLVVHDKQSVTPSSS